MTVYPWQQAMSSGRTNSTVEFKILFLRFQVTFFSFKSLLPTLKKTWKIRVTGTSWNTNETVNFSSHQKKLSQLNQQHLECDMPKILSTQSALRNVHRFLGRQNNGTRYGFLEMQAVFLSHWFKLVWQCIRYILAYLQKSPISGKATLERLQ